MKVNLFHISIVLCVTFLMLAGCGGQTSYQNNEVVNTQPKRASFEAEVTYFMNHGEMIQITNRNDYDWHNVDIDIDEYYDCATLTILKSGEQTLINGVECGNSWHMGHSVIQQVKIQADEGNAEYTFS